MYLYTQAIIWQDIKKIHITEMAKISICNWTKIGAF